MRKNGGCLTADVRERKQEASGIHECGTGGGMEAEWRRNGNKGFGNYAVAECKELY